MSWVHIIALLSEDAIAEGRCVMTVSYLSHATKGKMQIPKNFAGKIGILGWVMFKTYLLHCAIHSTLSEFYFLILSQLSSFECRFLLTAVWAQACHLSFGSRFQIPNCSSFLLRPIGAYIQRTVLRRVNCLVASLSLFSLSLVELREIDHLTKKWKPLQRKLSSKHTPLPRSMLPHLHHHQRLLTLL